jgi:hypothetical protein
VVGLIAIPAMAQPTPTNVQYSGPTTTNHATKQLDPPVFLENTHRNNAGWLSYYSYPGWEFIDDIGTIYSQGTKEQLYGTNMGPALPAFTMTGFDVGWFSADTNPAHVSQVTFTVSFYDNPPHGAGGGGDYTGYYHTVGTVTGVWVPQPPVLLQSYTATTMSNYGANYTSWDLGDDLGELDVPGMPVDLWMGVKVSAMTDGGSENLGMMLCKDWSGPNPWGVINGGAEYGHSDWWWALDIAGWQQYYNGPPTPTTGYPYYDAASPRGSFTYSIYGIPEPATLGLLALSGVAMIRRRR